MTMGMTTIIEMIFNDVVEEVLSDDPGKEEDHTIEDRDLLPLVLETLNTKAYPNINIYVVYATIKVIMTTNAIPSNTSSMLCNIKMDKVIRKESGV